MSAESVDDVLVGDVGGTKIRLAHAAWTSDRWTFQHVVDLDSTSVQSMPEALHRYRQEVGVKALPRTFSVGVAGPVRKGRATLTNLPWSVDALQLQNEFGFDRVFLANDLEAQAWSVCGRAKAELVCLRDRAPQLANAAFIAPGTGLGEATIARRGDHCFPLASEGGNSDFAPQSEEDCALLMFLRKRHEHVSWEMVVSGLFGFRNLFDFYVAQGVAAPSDLAAAMAATRDPGIVIHQAADSGIEIAERVMLAFCRYFGAEAGNVALQALALGGVYIGGGIAPKILPWLERSEFLHAMDSKGRFRSLIQDIPVYLVSDPYNALIGAANAACEIQDT